MRIWFLLLIKYLIENSIYIYILAEVSFYKISSKTNSGFDLATTFIKNGSFTFANVKLSFLIEIAWLKIRSQGLFYLNTTSPRKNTLDLFI